MSAHNWASPEKGAPYPRAQISSKALPDMARCGACRKRPALQGARVLSGAQTHRAGEAGPAGQGKAALRSFPWHL